MTKCKCGVELFDCDIVENEIEITEQEYDKHDMPKCHLRKEISTTYRCPKCFKTKKVKVK